MKRNFLRLTFFPSNPKWRVKILYGLAIALWLAASPASAGAEAPTKTPIHHLIFLLQENHTFDSYFGTYPGADGIPAGVKMPLDPNDPSKGYVVPFHIGNYPLCDLSHSLKTLDLQIDNGKMDGFVYAQNLVQKDGHVVMGYYNDQDLPYYYNIADNYVLFDRFFSSAKNGSFQNHMFTIAGRPPLGSSYIDAGGKYDQFLTIFDRLEEKHITWKFYVQNYEPNITYRSPGQGSKSEQVLWVPLLYIDRFLDQPELNRHIVDLSEYYQDLHNGTLPEVAYISPSGASEQSPGSVQTGQSFVRGLIQELMRSSYWSSSAFLWSYDDWGGWYDHVLPPQVDAYGYGLRVPALLVSAYARQGYVDHGTYDFTSVIKFIEENWGVDPVGGRDVKAQTFFSAFDFTRGPRPAVMLGDARPSGEKPKKVNTQVIYQAYTLAIGVGMLSIFWAIGGSTLRSIRPRRK